MEILSNLGVSLVFIILGFILKSWPPKQINHFYGYRTPFAKKNNEVWEEANYFSAIMMITGGIISLIFSLIITFAFNSNPDISNTISSMGSIVIDLALVFYTEVHLRRVFDKDGNRKSNS